MKEVLLSQGEEVGTVKRFSMTGGFGFIIPKNGGVDVFVNLGTLQRSGISTLDAGQTVAYRSVEKDGRQRAIEIKLINNNPQTSYSKRRAPEVTSPGATPGSEKWISGTIKWFDPLREFGFVQFEGGSKDAYLAKGVMLNKEGFDTSCRIQELPVQVIVIPSKNKKGYWIVKNIKLP